MQYEDRLVIYLDVLGFGNYISHTEQSRLGVDSKINNIDRYLKMLNEFVRINELTVSATKKITCFSDLIVISISTREIEYFAHEIVDLLYLMYNSITYGFLLRGSIVYGKIIHTADRVFGPALVKAYRYESEIAKFPRIIIEESVVKDVVEYYGDTMDPDFSNFNESLKYDSDGIYYLDYFSIAKETLDNLGQYIKYIKSLTAIMMGLADNPKLIEKYLWLNSRFITLIENDKFLNYGWDKEVLSKYDLEIFNHYMDEYRESEYQDKL